MKLSVYPVVLLGLLVGASCNYKQKSATKKLTAGESQAHHTSVFYHAGKYTINSSVINNNDNLPVLLQELETSTLKEINDYKHMPKVVSHFLQETDTGFRIANPGENWQVGCVRIMMDSVIMDSTGRIISFVAGQGLPEKLLLYLGLSENLMLLTYRTGGIATSDHVMVIKFDNEKVLDFWEKGTGSYIESRGQAMAFLKAMVAENLHR